MNENIDWEWKMNRQYIRDKKKYVLTTENMNRCAKSFILAFFLPILLSLFLIYYP